MSKSNEKDSVLFVMTDASRKLRAAILHRKPITRGSVKYISERLSDALRDKGAEEPFALERRDFDSEELGVLDEDSV